MIEFANVWSLERVKPSSHLYHIKQGDALPSYDWVNDRFVSRKTETECTTRWLSVSFLILPHTQAETTWDFEVRKKTCNIRRWYNHVSSWRKTQDCRRHAQPDRRGSEPHLWEWTHQFVERIGFSRQIKSKRITTRNTNCSCKIRGAERPPRLLGTY